MRTMFKKGDYIRKAGYDLFKYNTFNGEVIYSPYEVVRTVFPSNGRVFINDRSYPEDSEPVIITKEEAEKLYKEWLDIETNTVIGESRNQEFEHIREDTGEEKVALKRKEVNKILFKYSHMNPDAAYNVYKCSVCGGIHLGKIQEDEKVFY